MTDLTEFTPLDRDFTQEPHSVLDRLRAEGPVCRATMWGGVPVWLVTGYEEAKALLADPRLSKDNGKLMTLFPPQHNGAFQSEYNFNMVQSDPPDHTRLRKLVVKAFTARSVEHLRTRIEDIADELLADIDHRAAVDLMAAYAVPLPVRVIGSLLGVPSSRHDAFREAVIPLLNHSSREEKDAGRTTLARLLAELIAEKRKCPADDLISELIEARDDGDRLSEQELMSTCFLLIAAGFDTTVNLIGNGVFALLRNPAQLARLRADLSMIPNATEEFLRFDGPVGVATPRFTSVAVTVGDVEIPANEFVMVSLLSANRDDHHFDEPTLLDISRKPKSHLAFGHGIHHCLGAPLARLEANVAFEKLLTRFPRLELDTTQSAEFRDSTLMHGLAALHVLCR